MTPSSTIRTTLDGITARLASLRHARAAGTRDDPKARDEMARLRDEADIAQARLALAEDAEKAEAKRQADAAAAEKEAQRQAAARAAADRLEALCARWAEQVEQLAETGRELAAFAHEMMPHGAGAGLDVPFALHRPGGLPYWQGGLLAAAGTILGEALIDDFAHPIIPLPTHVARRQKLDRGAFAGEQRGYFLEMVTPPLDGAA